MTGIEDVTNVVEAYADEQVAAATAPLLNQISILQQTVNEQEAAMAAHMKEPAPAGHPVIDPAAKCLLGASYGVGADKSLYKSRPTAARVFFTGAAPANIAGDGQTKAAIADGATSIVYSWKGNATATELATSLNSIPDGVTAYGCYWHEPEDNIADGSLRLGDWRTRTTRDAKIMRDCGVIPVTILMGYTLATGSGRNPADYYMNGVVDGQLYDYYMNPAKGKDDPEGFMDKALADMKAGGGKFLGLGETGLPSSVAQTTAVALIKRLRAKLLAMPEAKMALYWSSGDFRFTEATANAWFDGT